MKKLYHTPAIELLEIPVASDIVTASVGVYEQQDQIGDWFLQ